MSFRPGIGGIAGLAPVATKPRSNDTCCWPPSASRTARLCLFSKRASPRSTVMAGVFARMPSYLAWRSSSTRPCCCWASSRSRRTDGGTGGRPGAALGVGHLGRLHANTYAQCSHVAAVRRGGRPQLLLGSDARINGTDRYGVILVMPSA